MYKTVPQIDDVIKIRGYKDLYTGIMMPQNAQCSNTNLFFLVLKSFTYAPYYLYTVSHKKEPTYFCL